MSCEDCKSGFNWNGTPVGKETKLADNNAYVTGDSKDAAILLLHDVFGWTFPNLRLLADHFAKEANATVYMPDYFDGEVIPADSLDSPEKREAINLPALIGRNNKEKRYLEKRASAEALKAQYPKVGAMGYCYGAWAAFKLGSDPSLIDAVCGAHPTLLEQSELDGLKVPIQLIAAQMDHAFTEELKAYANKVVLTLGVPYEYIFFPGVAHGFAGRGDSDDKVQKEALERAKRSVVSFVTEFLH